MPWIGEFRKPAGIFRGSLIGFTSAPKEVRPRKFGAWIPSWEVWWLAFLCSSAAALPRFAWHAPGNSGSHVLLIFLVLTFILDFYSGVFPAFGLSASLSRVARRSRLEYEPLEKAGLAAWTLQEGFCTGRQTRDPSGVCEIKEIVETV